MGQTNVSFVSKASTSASRNSDKVAAFERLEASRKRNAGVIDYDKEREKTLDQKYGRVE